MATVSLFNDENSDSDVEFEINKDYAEKYEQWRGKEVLQKLKDRYGSDVDLESDTDSSSSSSSDEEAITSPAKEKSFFKLLSLLKSGDPQILDEASKLSSNCVVPNSEIVQIKKKSPKPMFLRDYERKVLLGDSSIINGNKPEIDKEPVLGYYEQQEKLKESLKAFENKDEEDEEEDLIIVKTKTKQEQEVEEEEYKLWLKGQRSSIKDEDAKDFKYLRDYWTKSNLTEDEKFLKNFFLNQPYLNDEAEEVDDGESDIEERKTEDLLVDEDAVEQQENFEYKYNFRFQDPDPEFIKTYPRIIKSSMRRPDDRRKLKRAQIKERKLKEKERKKEELKQLKSLKKIEIKEKLKQIQEITGNSSLPFEDDDLEGDFDAEKYDKKMKLCFNDDYYQQPEGDNKPEFSEEDDDVNWDKWISKDNCKEDNILPDCEDPNFDMDADHNSHALRRPENGPNKKKWRLSDMLKQKKPVFDPSTKSYQEYLDEYYKLDYEDIIDDLPCRFKYREVVANNFGLSTEEILLADDRELNSWCSIKKCVQYKSKEQELQDVHNYRRKGENTAKKMHILSSLTAENPENPIPRKRRKSKKRKPKDLTTSILNQRETDKEMSDIEENLSEDLDDKSEVLNRLNKSTLKEDAKSVNSVKKEERIQEFESNQLSCKVKKRKHDNICEPINGMVSSIKENDGKVDESSEKNIKNENLGDNNPRKSGRSRRKRQRKRNRFNKNFEQMDNKTNLKLKADKTKNNFTETESQNEQSGNTAINKHKRWKDVHSKLPSQATGTVLSDERLKAYGFNPKKFRNKERYKPKFNVNSLN